MMEAVKARIRVIVGQGDEGGVSALVDMYEKEKACQ